MTRRPALVVGGVLIAVLGGLLGAAGPSAPAASTLAAAEIGASHTGSGLAESHWRVQPQALLQQELQQLTSREAATTTTTTVDEPTAANRPADHQRRSTAGGSVIAGGLDPGAAAAAVSFAVAQVGKPYLWGGTGPAAFDCSGLTQQAYRHAGVAIPRTSRQQARIGTPARLADLTPGDLLFYAYNTTDLDTVHHVTMYVGAGRVVHAPQAGDHVKLSPIWLTEYAGAIRPIPASAAHRTDTKPVGPTPTLEPSPTVQPGPPLPRWSRAPPSSRLPLSDRAPPSSQVLQLPRWSRAPP
ncbi:C40 family peptidase [Actinokineospora sp. HUAS TT18]|uniref:C40 family peptidase n=1 Tax=Actinokineospora sp. HUAS TT18 TaxID=3447451 RepID=UPI003F51EB95